MTKFVFFYISKANQYALAVSAMLLAATFGAYAASVAEESELKAAFVYNFTLFTTWPQTNRNLRMCLLGDVSYAAQMETYKKRNVYGATILIEKVQSANEARTCQVLIIGVSEHDQIGNINKALKGAPVLTVTEAGNLTPDTVHILLIKHNDRMAFDINQTAATASGLVLSFKLLKLARKVY